MPTSFEAFIARWHDATGEERANKDPFFIELCHLLAIEPPKPKGKIGVDPQAFGTKKQRADFSSGHRKPGVEKRRRSGRR
jgi:hypothetical protein